MWWCNGGYNGVTLENRCYTKCYTECNVAVYMSHHDQRISLGIVRAEARAYLDALARRKSDLVRIIGVVRARS